MSTQAVCRESSISEKAGLKMGILEASFFIPKRRKANGPEHRGLTPAYPLKYTNYDTVACLKWSHTAKHMQRGAVQAPEAKDFTTC